MYIIFANCIFDMFNSLDVFSVQDTNNLFGGCISIRGTEGEELGKMGSALLFLFFPILAKNCFYFVLIFAVALFKTCITFFANYYCES